MRVKGMEAAKPYFDDAIKTFDICSGIGNIEENEYKNRVVYLMGQCKQALKDYEGALQA